MRVISMPKEFVDLREAPIDIYDIENNVREFYGCLDIDEDEDIKTQCLDARSFLDSARLLLRNLVSAEENPLMSKYIKAYCHMQENLGRVDRRLNIVEEENIGQLQAHENYNRTKMIDSPFLRRYINSLLNCMQHLVYYPLKNALKKFNETIETEGGKKIIKNKNLFLYFIFLELLHSSESMGSITAEKGTGKKSTITSVHEPTEKEGYSSETDSPPSLPEDLPIEEPDSDMLQAAENLFDESDKNSEPTEKTIFEDEDMKVTEESDDKLD